MNHNPAGITAEMKDWTHDDLVTYLSWQVIQGITKGESINRICYQFPHLVLTWKEERNKAE